MTGVVSIVAGGWSFYEVDHRKVPGYVVAVNGAAQHLRCRVHAVVTMDRLWAQDAWPWAVEQHRDKGGPLWSLHARDAAIKNISPKEREDAPWLRPFRCRNTGLVPMSDDVAWLNGSNSGACALNLAYQARPRQLYLFGFDMCVSKKGLAYWYPHYAWTKKSGGTGKPKMMKWAREFDAMARQFADAGIKVTNVSAGTIIRSFPRATPKAMGVQR